MENPTNGSVNAELLKTRIVEVSVFEFIETKKFTAIEGESVYYMTKKDNSFMSDSLSHDKEKALAFFDNVVKNNGEQEVVKVLHSKTVKRTKDNN